MTETMLKHAAVTEALEAPGHWRCVFFLARGEVGEAPEGWIDLGDYEWLSPETFETERAADINGLVEVVLANAAFGFPAWEYVRAEFFPDYPKGGA